MTGSLLDTKILSEFAKGERADPAVRNWLATVVDDTTLYVSVLSFAEIRRGIESLAAGRRRLRLEDWFSNELIPFFANRILPVNQRIADRWAIVSIRLEGKGKTQPIIDGLLAATALEHQLNIVTRNTKDLSTSKCPSQIRWTTSVGNADSPDSKYQTEPALNQPAVSWN